MIISDKTIASYSTELLYYRHALTELTVTDRSPFVSHAHKTFEIFQLLHGNVTYIIDGVHYNMSEGDLIVVNKNGFHDLVSHSDIYERRVIEFDSALIIGQYTISLSIINFFEKGNKFHKGRVIPAKFIGKSNINQIYENMQKSVEDKINVEAFLHVYIVEILLELHKIVNKYEVVFKNFTVNESVAKIILYIEQNITKKITLDRLEKICYMSRFYICRLFKQHTGTTILNYITLKKMIHAENVISQGFAPTKVYEMLGYNNYSNFLNQYKKFIKKKPSDK